MGENTKQQEKLPNFIIIGAGKSGTTSLYHYLNEHPQVFMSPIKETNFFTYQGRQNDTSWTQPISPIYFPVTSFQEYLRLFENATSEPIIGEASPYYLASPIAAKRIKECLPEVKLLAILRNPADRAFSSYAMHVKKGVESISIYDALKEGTHYVRGGLYYEQLKRYFETLPKEQIKVCLYDDLRKDPYSLIKEIYFYLGVGSDFTPNFEIHHNVGGMPKNQFLARILAKFTTNTSTKRIGTKIPAVKQMFNKIQKSNISDEKMPFPDDLRRNLIDYYREDILKTQDLIGRDLTHWLT